MPDLTISQHAVERYQERIANLPDDEVRAVLSCPAVRLAAEFGARFVRLATGQRIVLAGSTVVTVMPAEDYRKQVRRHGLGRFGCEPVRGR